jgi:chromosomal replication initiator protein
LAEGGAVQVTAINAAQIQYLEAHCKPAFTEAVQAATGRLLSVAFKAAESVEPVRTGATGQAPDPGGLVQLNPGFVLNRFVAGPCNQLALSAAVAVAEQPGMVYNPLVVYGAHGIGKTHLLQGVVRAAGDRLGAGRCLYVPCGTFVDDAVRALEDGWTGELRERYGAVALLAVDDVHLLAGRERSQEEFFHVLNSLLASQRQVVLSADRLPSEIADLQPRLASRITAGLTVVLDMPCLETRMAILKDKARLLGIGVPEEVVRMIAERYDDVRAMADALVRLDTLSGFESSPITLGLAERSLGPVVPDRSRGSKRNHAIE